LTRSTSHPTPSPRGHARRRALVAGGLALALAGGGAVLAAPGAEAGAGASASSAQTLSAAYAAGFLARSVQADGSVLSGSSASVSDTVRAALGLAVSGHGRLAFTRAVGYLGAHVDDYTESTTAGVTTVRPGATGLLTVVAVAAGQDPTAFGTPATDLVDRLVGTQQSSGQLGAGGDTFNHALGLLGLEAARGDSRAAAAAGKATSYLLSQQCGDGGFTFSARASTATDCGGQNASDSDTSSYAFQALSVAGALTPARRATALSYLHGVQNTDGGFGGYGTAAGSNADSTGVAASAIGVLGGDPDGVEWSKGGSTPAALLRAFQAGESAPNDGAYSGDGKPADDYDLPYGTEEALPGELGVTLPVGIVTLADDEPRQSPPHPAGTGSGARPTCAQVVTPKGTRVYVPVGCLVRPAAQTPCTVQLKIKTGATYFLPTGCTHVAPRLTPCSIATKRNHTKVALPKGCRPEFPVGQRRAVLTP